MKVLLATVALLTGAGCSSLGSSAVRTGALKLPPHAGPVAVFAAGQPQGGAELGVVEVHASQSEGRVEELLPLFVRKVAELGGNAAVIDSVGARFEIVEHAHVETYSYPCGFYLCTGTHMYSANDEVMIVSMRGRAFALGMKAATRPEVMGGAMVPPPPAPYVPTLPEAMPPGGPP
jgi:hypothetical protein